MNDEDKKLEEQELRLKEQELRNILSIQAIYENLKSDKKQNQIIDILKVDRKTLLEIINFNNCTNAPFKPQTLKKIILEATKNEEIKVVDFTSTNPHSEIKPVFCNSHNIAECFQFFKSYEKVNWKNCSKKYSEGFPEEIAELLKELNNIITEILKEESKDFSFDNIITPTETARVKFTKIITKLNEVGIQLHVAKACNSLHYHIENYGEFSNNEGKYQQKSPAGIKEVDQNKVGYVQFEQRDKEELIKYLTITNTVLCDPEIFIGIFDFNSDHTSKDHILFYLKTPLIKACSEIESSCKVGEHEEYNDIACHGKISKVVLGDLSREKLRSDFNDNWLEYLKKQITDKKATAYFNPVSRLHNTKGSLHVERFKIPKGTSHDVIKSEDILICQKTSAQHYIDKEYHQPLDEQYTPKEEEEA